MAASLLSNTVFFGMDSWPVLAIAHELHIIQESVTSSERVLKLLEEDDEDTFGEELALGDDDLEDEEEDEDLGDDIVDELGDDIEEDSEDEEEEEDELTL